MMTENQALGFAIPTYRRPQLLDRALHSIVPQASAFGLPIYICDDSCDQTNELAIKKWQTEYPGIIHEINERNLGIDRNIDRAVTRCPSRFVHVLGEDDVIFPGFAEAALAQIATGDPAHIICSYLYLSNDFEPISNRAVIPPDVAGSSLRMFLPRYGWALGFIGANIFNRARYSAGGLDGYGTYFHHLVRIITTVEPDETVGLIKAPLVGNRADDESTASWTGDRINVVFGIEAALSASMQGRYSAAEISRSVSAARTHLGYAQTARLLYWAHLSEQEGKGQGYWDSLSRYLPDDRCNRLKSTPGFVKILLAKMFPLLRSAKRTLRKRGE